MRNGERVKIQEQPLQILLSLLQTPGELVPREELWERLWPGKNVEDSDRSLRVAAAKLRLALGEDPSFPRLIETLPKRGYQFIGQIKPITEIQEPEQGLPTSPAIESRPRSVQFQNYKILFAVIAFAVASAGIWFYKMHVPGLLPTPNPDTPIVVGGVKNSTGEKELDGVLSPALQAKLQESPYLNLGSEGSFRKLVSSSEAGSLQNELNACRDVHAQEIVDGELRLSKDGYDLKLSAWRCLDGRLLTTQTSRIRSEGEILSALDFATTQLRRALGETQSSIEKFNVPAERAMTGSLGALKAFTEGEQKHLSGMDSASIEDYRLAIALDSEFALAYARLGAVYTNVEEYTAAAQYYRKAFDLRDRTTERERFYITSHYFSNTGEVELAKKALQLWREVYPRDAIAANNLADMYDRLGEVDKALQQAQAAVQLDPSMNYAYINLVWAYLRTGHYAELNRLCSTPMQGKTDSLSFRVACFQGDFVQNNVNGMRDELQRAKGDPAESLMLASAAWTSFYKGQLKEATRLFLAAEDSARTNHLDESAAEISLDQASLEADVDLPAIAKARALNALHASPRSPNVQAFAAVALARSGDYEDADRVIATVAAQRPSDTILKMSFYRLHVLQSGWERMM